MAGRTPRTLADPPSFGHRRVSDGITAYLRDQIMSGQLRGGDHLRVESLAEQLNVSITPVRESLLELFGEGFLDREAGRGYIVSDLSRADIEELYVVLALLAGELAARAAPKMSDADLAALTTMQAQLEVAVDEGEADSMEAINHKIHKLINKAADSRKLAWFLQRASRYAPRWTWQEIDGWPSAARDDHRAIIDALTKRNGDFARNAMIIHMQHTGSLLIEHLAKRGFWEGQDG